MSRLLALAGWVETTLQRRVAWVLLAALLAGHCAVLVSRRMGDFYLYHRAAERLLADEPIYRLEDPHRYLYAPPVTFLFTPFAVLPPVPAAVLWYLLNIVLVVHALRLVERLVYDGGRAPPGVRLLALLPVVRFVDNNLGHGQINILLLWLVLVAYDAAGRGQHLRAGFALAAPVFMKLFPLVLLLQLALARQWRFLAATCAALATLLVAPIAWWGDRYYDVLGHWIAVLRAQAGHYDTANKINQSIAAFVHRSFLPYAEGTPLIELPAATASSIGMALHGAFVVALVTYSLTRPRRSAARPAGEEGAELGLYLLYATVASTYSWKYYFIDLLLPLAVVVRRASEGRQWGGAVVWWAVFMLNLLPGLRLFGKSVGHFFQLASLHFLAAVVLFVVVAWAQRSLRPPVPRTESVC